MRVFAVNQGVTESVTGGVTGEQKRAGREDGFFRTEKQSRSRGVVTGRGHRSVTNPCNKAKKTFSASCAGHVHHLLFLLNSCYIVTEVRKSEHPCGFSGVTRV